MKKTSEGLLLNVNPVLLTDRQRKDIQERHDRFIANGHSYVEPGTPVSKARKFTDEELLLTPTL